MARPSLLRGWAGFRLVSQPPMTTHPIHEMPTAQRPPSEPDAPEESERWLEEEGGLVGSLVWKLQKGEQWVLGPDCAFLFKGCWRRAIVREAYMLAEPASRDERIRDRALTLFRRWVTGEPFLLDLYEALEDDAELGISSDEIGGSLYAARVDRGPLLLRKCVYFGSETGVSLRAATPLTELRRDMSAAELLALLKRTAYGPGWVLQRFERLGDSLGDHVILQIDGDPILRELEPGETLRTDPRHAYAWDATVSWRLIEFGTIADRLLRGSVPYQVEFEGPGRLWLSNVSFPNGYLGHLFTPSHWFFAAMQLVRRALGLLNPANWI